MRENYQLDSRRKLLVGNSEEKWSFSYQLEKHLPSRVGNEDMRTD